MHGRTGGHNDRLEQARWRDESVVAGRGSMLALITTTEGVQPPSQARPEELTESCIYGG